MCDTETRNSISSVFCSIDLSYHSSGLMRSALLGFQAFSYVSKNSQLSLILTNHVNFSLSLSFRVYFKQ